MNPLIKHSHHLSSVPNKSSLYSQTLYQKRFPNEQKKTIKRSKTQNVIQKVRKKDILNEQDITKVPSKNNNSKIRYFGSNFDQGLKFQSSNLQKIRVCEQINLFARKIDERQSFYNGIQQDKQKTMKVHKNSQKLLQKITDHRRVRSSSKISSRIIQLNTFFKQPKTQSTRIPIERLNSQMLQPKLAQETLQNILQLKLRTQNDPIQCSNQLLSFRNTFSSSGNSKLFGFTFGSNLHKVAKINDILSKQQLNNSKQVIKLNEQMRKSKNLKPNPKQWQFHNCLTLQKIELYSTNLKISCQGWVVLDHLELKYLRGWNPKVQDDFSPLIRLFVAKICYDLPQIANYHLDIQKILIRVNDKHIYKDEKQKYEKTRGINPHSILNLKKLITAMLITSHDDLVVYSILALGYILFLISNNIKSNIRQQRDPLEKLKKSEFYEVFIQSTERAVLQLYCQHFERECHKICQELDIPKTRVVVGFNCLFSDYNKKIRRNHNNFHEYTVSSSSLDMSVLFMKCLGDRKFKEALSHRIYEAQIKYQMGWNFWQTRNQKWSNEQYVKYRLKAVGGRSNKGNQCFSIWDDQRNILITMADCKINMHWKDTERIQDWVQKHINRFSKTYFLSMNLYPTDSQKFEKVN